MDNTVAQYRNKEETSAFIWHLERLVTRGPRDLDIVWAMSAYGYDAAKWAEGQGMLAELLSYDQPGRRLFATAREWYNEAAAAAQRALVKEPRLLAKLGVAESMV
jgi:hypothetical protein